jgi:large subunit ribosomal protein L33
MVIWVNRTIIVRLISTAQTGYFYSTTRARLGPRLSAIKYDPTGVPVLSNALFIYADLKVFDHIVKQRVLFVESKKSSKKS